uniref:(northern house mosquito) hypothetical protein n=1 Tax=Culex pipiens TaxID=7175 RepID=A0A8D8AA61_CULPI
MMKFLSKTNTRPCCQQVQSLNCSTFAHHLRRHRPPKNTPQSCSSQLRRTFSRKQSPTPVPSWAWLATTSTPLGTPSAMESAGAAITSIFGQRLVAPTSTF